MRKSDLNLEDILSDRPEEAVESPLAERVFNFFRLIAAVLVLVVVFQVLMIGVFGNKDYAQRAVANASNFRIVRAERGLITDRFHKPLVGNEKAFFAFLVVKDLPEDAALRDNIIFKVSNLLNLDVDKIRLQVVEHSAYFNDQVILKEALSYDELVQVTALNLSGVKVEEGFRRTHDVPLTFSHILGYTGLVTEGDIKGRKDFSASDYIGKMGLEKYYDEYLRGRNGREVYFRDSLGKVQDKKMVELPNQGGKVETYIDKELQTYFYDRLSEELRRLDRKVGVGIALNPNNGEVLAMFSVPGFDTKNISQYLNDSDRILFNRAVSGLYNPGSTIKPLHALAALAEGVADPAKKIYSSGQITIPNPYNPAKPSIFKDWKAHGWVDLRSAIARSSNVYFYAIGGGYQDQVGLGVKRLKKWWGKFRFDDKTEIDLPAEETGFLPDPEWKKEKTGVNWLLGDTYNISIGQGDVVLTPIELMSYIGAIANGGKFYQPRLMKRVIGADGKIIAESGSVLLDDFSDEVRPYIHIVQEGMLQAVKEPYGTAYMLHDVPMTIYGKTGSAQFENNKKINAFFVGYTDDLAIMVLVENAREGSINTLGVARDVFMWYYENRIKKQTE